MKTKPTLVFCSYCHADTVYKERLLKQLRPMVKNGEISLFDDEAITAGSELDRGIMENLREAGVVILMISSDFLTSTYCLDIEYAEAIRRRQHEGVRVLSIICRPCDWKHHADIPKYKVLPRDGKPISLSKNKDQIFLDIQEEFRRALGEYEKGMPNKVGVEKEFKFLSDANTQFKFAVVLPPEQMLEKLRSICEIAEIRIGEGERIKIVDEYFADAENSLRKTGCSFRRRSQNGEQLVTFKMKKGPWAGGSLERFEHEFPCTDQELWRLIDEPQHFKSVFRQVLGDQSAIPKTKLRKFITLENNRLKIPLDTHVAKYSFCYDQFHFFDDNTGLYSENYSEIEIETVDSKTVPDEKLEELVGSVSSFFQHSPDSKTKAQRGLDWLESKEESEETVIAVSLEILEFQGMQSAYQKNALQYLNHIAKQSFANRLAGTDSYPVCLSTGDGMIFLFSEKATSIPGFLSDVQSALKAKQKIPAKNFTLRAGIARGGAFKFSDSNGGFGYGGDAIHLAKKVMHLGGQWNMLATDSARSEIFAGRSTEFRQEPRRYKTFDGEELEVFNLHEHSTRLGPEYGNPADPLSR